MIKISIDKRREYLKKIYNALNASPISHTYTPEKIKDIAITSEYECCENSRSESEYYSGIVQIIQRILSTTEKPGPGREVVGRPLKPRPTAISNSQVFFCHSMGTSNVFGAMPGTRLHKITQCHPNRPEVNINNMYVGRTLDPSAQTGYIPATIFSRHSYSKPQAGGHVLGQGDFMPQYAPDLHSHPKPQAGGHVPGQGDFMPQYAPDLHSYQIHDCTGPQLLRRPEVIHSNVTHPFRKWNMHDRDMDGLHNVRVTAPVRGSVLRNFEGTKMREKHKNAGRTHMSLGEASIPAHGNVLRSSPFLSAGGSREDGLSLRHSFADTDALQRNTKEDVLKASYSYAQGKREPQILNSNSISDSKCAGNMCYSCGPQRASTSMKPDADECGDIQATNLPNLGGLGSEILEFDLSEKLADTAIGDCEKKVIRSKLSGFQEELLAIEEDAAKHAGLGCSPDLNKKLETTCRIVHAQIEYISDQKYFLREVFLDVAIERIRKYAVLIRNELEIAQKNSDVYDFNKVCEKVKKAFRKMKSADSNFVFCIDPQ